METSYWAAAWIVTCRCRRRGYSSPTPLAVSCGRKCGRTGSRCIRSFGRRDPGDDMTRRSALSFVKRNGIVLESARGPVPNLAEAVVGGRIRGSWWSHARGKEIFWLTRAVRDSADVLVCRLVGGKITYVHRRLGAGPGWVAGGISTRGPAAGGGGRTQTR